LNLSKTTKQAYSAKAVALLNASRTGGERTADTSRQA
jgi:hypothetical protein